MAIEREGDGTTSAVADGRVDSREANADGLIVDRGSDVEPTLSVVLPTLNEEEGVRTCIEQIESAVAELGLTTEIIVSDSSTDRTPQIAREMGAIVVEPDEAGYGNSTATQMVNAVDESNDRPLHTNAVDRGWQNEKIDTPELTIRCIDGPP